MPATVDTSQYLEALSTSTAIDRIERFAAQHHLEAALHKRVLPILGLPSLDRACPESLPAVMHMLQVASLYPDPLDVSTPEYA